jgi:3-oxoacyl-[acyl-carrier-protein] synthase-3
MLVQSLEKALERCGRGVKDLKLIVPHQANYRILEAAARKLELEPEIMVNDIANYGNTSAGTIPIALSDAVKAGKINKGDLIALVAFGGGLTWGSVIIEW